MLKKLALFLYAVLCTTTIYAVEYAEVEAQSTVFTLTAGGSSEIAIINSINKPINLNNGVTIRITNSRITLNFIDNNSSADIAIYNIMGKSIIKKNGFTGAVFHTELEHLASGVYTVMIKFENKKHIVRRFIVEK